MPPPHSFLVYILSFPGVRRHPPHSSPYGIVCPFPPSSMGEYTVKHCPLSSIFLLPVLFLLGQWVEKLLGLKSSGLSPKLQEMAMQREWPGSKINTEKGRVKRAGCGHAWASGSSPANPRNFNCLGSAYFGLVWFSPTLLFVTFLSFASIEVWPKTFKETSAYSEAATEIGCGVCVWGAWWRVKRCSGEVGWAGWGGGSWRSLSPISILYLQFLQRAVRKTSRK